MIWFFDQLDSVPDNNKAVTYLDRMDPRLAVKKYMNNQRNSLV